MAEIFVLASGKGGVGKSTCTAELSKALASLGKRVLAIDCDIGLRSLDLLLDYEEQVVFDWGDIILSRCETKRAIISGKVDFIAAPRSFDENFTGENLKKIIEELSGDYDYIFLDAPAGVGIGFQIAALCADNLIAVTTPDNICVRSCNIAYTQAEKLGIANAKLIINMFEKRPVSKGRLLNLDECIDETQIPLLGVVPMDRKLAFASVTGLKPDEFSPSNQAFFRIAKRLMGEKVDLVFE